MRSTTCAATPRTPTPTSDVTLATSKPIGPQRPLGRDVHFWSAITGFDALPIGHLLRTPPHMPVNDDGRYRRAVTGGRLLGHAAPGSAVTPATSCGVCCDPSAC